MISGIHISTSEMVIQPGADKKKLPNFIKGQTLLATVLSGSSKGKAQLLVNGQKLMAKTPMLLTAGQQVELKVLQEKDSVILKLIGPVQKVTTGQMSSLVGLFSKNGSISDISGSKIKSVESLLHELALKSDKADEAFLPKLIQKSGLALENKLAQILTDKQTLPEIKASLDNLLKQDIKGNFLKEMMEIGSGRTDAVKTVSGFLETIENFQLLNHNSSESGRILLPFPVFSQGAFQFGQLLIDTGGKPKKDGEDADKLIRVSFLLNMTNLGPLRADFSVLKKDITGQFLFEDDDTCEYVRSMLGDLKARLAGLEYHVHKLECKTVKKEALQESSLIETLVKSEDDQVLNIVI